MKAICILSGGLDSTTLLYQCIQKFDTEAMTFFYNQRHKREIEMAKLTCQKLQINHHIIDLGSIPVLKKSALTDKDIKIPHGHYEAENMKLTVVPNRNMTFLSIACAYAYSIDAEIVAIGVHSGDHAVYPDCRKGFISDFETLVNKGNSWFQPLRIYTPFIDLDKGDIVQKGIELGVDYLLTQTCYEGNEVACGLCGSCSERISAFNKNNIKDPIQYREHWDIILEKAKKLEKRGLKCKK